MPLNRNTQNEACTNIYQGCSAGMRPINDGFVFFMFIHKYLCRLATYSKLKREMDFENMSYKQ